MREITCKYNYDDGLITFFIDGERFDEWATEGGEGCIKESLDTFKKIYKAGYDDGASDAIEHL